MSRPADPVPVRLSSSEGLVLRTLLRLGEEDGGDRSWHNVTEVASKANLGRGAAEWALGSLTGKELAESQGFRYRVRREEAARALGLDPDASAVLPQGPRQRLSALAG